MTFGMQRIDSDLLIIGSGAAGLYAAWRAARLGQRVTLVTEGALLSGASHWAQGGIAAVTSSDDTLAAHVADTLAAGRGLCDDDRVALLVRDGATRVAELIGEGMAFDRDAHGALCRGLEGGHSRHRILHAMGAATGRALTEFLAARVAGQASVQIIEQGFAYRLLVDDAGRCRGATVYRPEHDDNLVIDAPATLLATGGYAGLYARSTNPPGAIGTGLVLAEQAGAALADLEFVQFHPTAFYSPSGETFLLTEALRGAGATLVDARGERFVADLPGAELAPRDAVAAAIHARCIEDGRPFVGLDLRHLAPSALAAGFGELLARVAAAGIDITREPIPVAPAAHYCIGGIVTDDIGATAVPGLYAAGETAATGVHGANRLASNSLLECLVFAERAVLAADHETPPGSTPWPAPAGMQRARTRAGASRERLAERGAWLMHDVGIERDANGLARAGRALAAAPVGWPALADGGCEYFDVRDRGAARLAAAIGAAAAARPQSAGVHRRRDDPSVSVTDSSSAAADAAEVSA